MTEEGVRPAAGYPAIIPYLLVADANALIGFFDLAGNVCWICARMG